MTISSPDPRIHSINPTRRGTAPYSPIPGIPIPHRPTIKGYDEFDQIGTTRNYRQGQLIFAEDDSANDHFKVVQGVVSTFRMLIDGRRQITEFSMAGDYFGLFTGDSYKFSAQALMDATVICYAKQRMDAWLERNPAGAKRLLALVSDKLCATHEHTLILGRMSAREKVAAFLLQMAERTAEPKIDRDKHCGQVLLPMTRLDIADYLGLTIETTSRTFHGLKHSRIIALPEPNRVLLLRPDLLQRIVSGQEQ